MDSVFWTFEYEGRTYTSTKAGPITSITSGLDISLWSSQMTKAYIEARELAETRLGTSTLSGFEARSLSYQCSTFLKGRAVTYSSDERYDGEDKS